MVDTIQLGEKYEDNIHGVVGVATAHCKYLTGCDQIKLEYMKDGEVHSIWFDIISLVGVKVPSSDKQFGGPQSHAPARHQ